mgnify:CR=1 FL=1
MSTPDLITEEERLELELAEQARQNSGDWDSVKPGKAVVPPAAPVYAPEAEPPLLADSTDPNAREMGAKTLRVSGLVSRSPVPRARPARADARPDPLVAQAARSLVAALT